MTRAADARGAARAGVVVRRRRDATNFSSSRGASDGVCSRVHERHRGVVDERRHLRRDRLDERVLPRARRAQPREREVHVVARPRSVDRRAPQHRRDEVSHDVRVVRRHVVHLLAERVPEPPLAVLGGGAGDDARADDANVRASSGVRRSGAAEARGGVAERGGPARGRGPHRRRQHRARDANHAEEGQQHRRAR